MTLKREFVYIDEGILYGYGYEPNEVGSVEAGDAYFVPHRRKDISDSEEESKEESKVESKLEEIKVEEIEQEEAYPLPLGLPPLPPIKKCKVKAVSEVNNEEYTYNSILEAAQDLKIYARMIHHALDEENQTLFSKRLKQRFFFYKND